MPALPIRNDRYHPFQTLDTEFDSFADRQSYLRAIRAEIRSRGAFRSGIDVEPSFQNGAYWNIGADSGDPASIQLAWEAERRRVRAQEDAKIDRQWEEAGAHSAWADARKRATILESIVSGKSITQAAESIGLSASCVPIIGRMIYMLILRELVPSDDDGTIRDEILKAPIAESISLIRIMSRSHG